MTIEAAATVITVAFLAWAWHVARTPSRHRHEAEQRVAARPSSWDGSAEQKQLNSAGEIRRYSSDSPY